MTSHTHSFAPEIIGQQSPSAPSASDCLLLCPGWEPPSSAAPSSSICPLPCLSSVGEALGHLQRDIVTAQLTLKKHVQEWKWTEAFTMHNHGES